jgi:uncharacterized protein GlcG (DUF336 family)
MLKRIALAGLVLFAMSAGARAQDSALVTFKVLSPPVALELASAALQACRDKGFQVAVAVVDRFGAVQVILRDQLAGPHTPETARRKAWTAVSFRSDTLSLAAATQAGEVSSGVRFVEGVLMLGGGVPVEAAGAIVGAVGISGAPGGDEDDACGRAGIAAINDKIQF